MGTGLSQELYEKVAGWPTEAEAAEALGCSVRSVNRYAEKGLIEMQKRQRIGVKPENVCNPVDLEKLKPKSFVMPDGDMVVAAESGGLPVRAQRPNVLLGPLVPILQTMADAFQAMQTVQTEAKQLDQKLVLTLRDAVQFGFSKAYLKRAVASGTLKAFRDGQQIKISRDELERFAASTKALAAAGGSI